MSPRARRVEPIFAADCNGNENERCGWSTPYSESGFRVKEAAKAHARAMRHETVVTETTLVVYDRRPR